MVDFVKLELTLAFNVVVQHHVWYLYWSDGRGTYHRT